MGLEGLNNINVNCCEFAWIVKFFIIKIVNSNAEEVRCWILMSENNSPHKGDEPERYLGWQAI